ncbi:MAG: CarD family transcriptional regulator [Victivallaceae bacterium]|nr:CarD family transcriptional regulator [Victivallaceae bacterium]
MKKWREKIKKFLSASPETESLRQIDETVLPYAAWAFGSGGGPSLFLLPGGRECAALAESLRMLAAELGEPRRVELLPELPGGRLLTLEQEAEYLNVLFKLVSSPPDILVASAGGLIERAPSPERLKSSRMELGLGGKPGFRALVAKLVELDYDDEFEVASPGEFSRRGGIVDVFSPAHDFPVRLEFWGDELVSMRRFSVANQRSEGRVDSYSVIAGSLPARDGAGAVFFSEYVRLLKLRPVLVWPDICYGQLKNFGSDEKLAAFAVEWGGLAGRCEWGGGADAGSGGLVEPFGCFPAVAHLTGLLPEEVMESSLELVRGQIRDQVEQWLDTGYTVVMGGRDAAGLSHIRRWLEAYDLSSRNLEVTEGSLPAGVLIPELKLVFLNEKELFAVNLKRGGGGAAADGGAERTPSIRSRLNLDSCDIVADLNEGDCAVHVNYGIAIFRGIQVLAGRESRREVMVLEYADEKMLYVPLTQAHLVSRYMGSAGKAPLSRLNSKKWRTDCAGAIRSVREYAADLLRMQAVRRSVPNLALPPEDYEQLAFENGCGFELTRDQVRAVSEVKGDLAAEHPMDRLLCGDVGFGKTEVAMVAAFRMAMAGYQVAVLAPTTILVQQHFYSFRERFAEYALEIEMVSRFRSPAEQKRILERAAQGKIDILIGTHRICQNDVTFANLGLVIVDEEQRFGVKHKDILRRFRASANVLSMSATPIPRTLYLAMAGARDLSTIMTAPRARLPVKTVICGQRDPDWVGVVKNELSRGGQVYYLHNRVKSIMECAAALRVMFPHAAIAVGHGQMEEEELERVMAEFLAGRVDILVSTTIIESGLDVGNANTIVIERADRFGLAELYQLRGRVGRSPRQAYACLLLPRSEMMTLDGRKRIAAIRRYSNLGAGFQLALRDLEIRGAGNLLGEEQSGYVRSIGFELYCQLLANEIKTLKGEKSEFLPEVDLALDFVSFAWEAPDNLLPAGLPPDYIESERLRVEAYRKLSRASSLEELAALREEFRDRYGVLPEAAENLFGITRIRIQAARKNYVGVSVGDGLALFRTVIGTPFRIDGKIPTVSPLLSPRRKLARLAEIANLL